ncbi:MAG: PAS domain S-box protein [Planctomycetales bacterium]|nr:PAS domain S-box protein [Planctomycetales bacterium]
MSSAANLRATMLALVIVVLGTMATGNIVYVLNRSTLRQEAIRFEKLAGHIQHEIECKIREIEHGLHGTRRIFTANPQLDYTVFKLTLDPQSLVQEYNGSLGIGYIERLRDKADERTFVSELQREGSELQEIQIFEKSGNSFPGRPELAGRFVVRYIEPAAINRSVLGLDMGSEPARRMALEYAAISNTPTVTSALRLVQLGDRPHTGVLYVLPVFAPGQMPSTVEERLASLQGWVYMPVLIDQVVAGVESVVENQLEYRLVDGTLEKSFATLSESPNFSSNSGSDGESPQTTTSWSKWLKKFPLFRELAQPKPLVTSLSFDVGNRTWSTVVTPSASFAYDSRIIHWLLAGGGTLLSLLLGWIVRLQLSANHKAESTAREMSIDLMRFTKIAEHTTNGVLLTDQHRNIIWVNAGFTKFTGFTLEDVKGRTPCSILPCDRSDAKAVECMRGRLAAGEGFQGEIVNQRKNGEYFWFQLDIQPLFNERRKLLGYLVIANDISEVKEYAAQVELATEKADFALAGSKLALWEWDLIKDRLQFDHRWLQLVGQSDHGREWTSDYWFSRLHPDDVATFRAALRDCFSNGDGVFECEHRLQNEKGGYIWLHARGQIVGRDLEGQVKHLAGTFMEITARKEAEHALRSSEAKSSAIFLNSNDAILLIAGERIVECNPKTTTLFGIASREELRHSSWDELSPEQQPSGANSSEQFGNYLQHCLETGSSCFEWVFRRGDSTFTTEVVLSAFELDGEQMIQATVRDISQRLELQRQLAQAHKLESIGQLASGVAHEINTPMQCVFSNVEFLREKFELIFSVIEQYRQVIADPRIRRRVADKVDEIEEVCDLNHQRTNMQSALCEAVEGSQRVIEIVRAMKTMAYPGTSQKVPTDINKLINDASLVARNCWKGSSHLDLKLDHQLGLIPALPAQLSQVILNLIVNASDAIEEKIGCEPSELGRIKITTQRQSDSVYIEVSDTGIGIAEDIRHRIFDHFFTTKEVGKGNGQGLAIVYDIVVNQHAGTISVDSTPLVGTKFKISLPLNEAVTHDESSASVNGVARFHTAVDTQSAVDTVPFSPEMANA